MTKFEKSLLGMLGVLMMWLFENYTKTGYKDYVRLLQSHVDQIER